MKKSLKKVISAIAVLALSTSSFVALAKDFPDVADTANYAKAVDQLTGMGIVEGRDDGTFDPDATVTRAEITTMIIRALGSQDAAVSMSGQDTVFTDVDHNHWAAGYVAVANTITPRFVQGMGDGTFAPDATVTYAQAITMLVRALGYESLAAGGGYPNGYLAQAASIGMLDGFAVTGNDVELNRGQVAILIDNATVNCPILGEGEWTTTLSGGQYAPEIKSGTNPYNGNFWQSLAVNKHDVYQVYGTVTETRASSGTNRLEADEVQIEIQKSKRFEDMAYGFGNYGQDNPKRIDAYIGDTDADQNLNQYAEMLIYVDNDDEYTILSFTPNGRTDNITFKATQYDADKAMVLGGTNPVIYFTDESGSNSRAYRLNNDSNGVTWYLNNTQMTVNSVADVEQYLVDSSREANNYVGTVTLTDSKGINGSSSPDGRYDSVNITYYNEAVVDEVTVSNSGRVSITMLATDNSNKIRTPFYIDPDDDDVVVKFQGDATSYEELQQYDVLSFQLQPGTTASNSENITITVSRNSVTGTMSKKGTDDLTGNALYTFADGEYAVNESIVSYDLESSTEYTLYLDAFGYIAYVEEGASSKNYAVVDRMYSAEGGSSYKVKIYAADGSAQIYDYYRQNEADFVAAAKTYAYDNVSTIEDLRDSNRKAVQNRVVTYLINSTGQIRFTGNKPATPQVAEDKTYVLNSDRIGNIRMSENTNVLDLTEYGSTTGSGDVSVMGALQDGSDYTAYGYGESQTDSTYSFVIVTKGTSGLSVDSPVAVIKSKAETDYGDGNTTQVTVLTDGEEKDLVVDVESKLNINGQDADDVLAGLGVGDVFIYQLGSDNKIIRAAAIFAQGMSSGNRNYGEFVKNVFNTAKTAYDNNTNVGEYGTQFDAMIASGAPTPANYETALGGNFKGTRSTDEGYFTFGPVIDNRNGVTLGKLDKLTDGSWVSYIDSAETSYGYDSDCDIYAYDWGMSAASQRVYGTAGSSSIQQTSYNNKNLANVDGARYINWANYGIDNGSTVEETPATGYNQTNVAFALLEVVGGDITVGYTMVTPE